MKRQNKISYKILLLVLIAAFTMTACTKTGEQPGAKKKNATTDAQKEQPPKTIIANDPANKTSKFCRDITIPSDVLTIAKKDLDPLKRLKTLNKFFGQCLSCGSQYTECKDIQKTIRDVLIEMKIKKPLQTNEFATNLIQVKKKQGSEVVACTLAKAMAKKYPELKRDAIIYCLKDEDTKKFITAATSDLRKIDNTKAMNDINHFEWIILLCEREFNWQPAYCPDVASVYTDYVQKYKKLFNSKLYEKVIYVLNDILKDHKTAEALADEGIAKYGNNQEIIKQAVNVSIALNKKDKALKILNNAVKKAPENENLKFELAAFYLSKMKDEKKAAEIINGIKVNETNQNLHKAYEAWLKITAGDCKAGISILKNCPKCKDELKKPVFVKAVLRCSLKTDQKLMEKIKKDYGKKKK